MNLIANGEGGPYRWGKSVGDQASGLSVRMMCSAA